MKNKQHFLNLPPSQRQNLFRLKSAKQEKRLEKSLKQKKEELKWRFQKINQKLDLVRQKKHLLDVEDEHKREQKLSAYFERTKLISYKRCKSPPMRAQSSPEEEDASEDYEGRDTEREIRAKISSYEDKMMRATRLRQ